MRLVVASTVTCIAIGVANLTPFVPEGIAPHLSQLLGLIASVTLLACLFGWARAALRWSDAANGLDWREITRAQGREPAPCCLAGMLVVAGPVVEAGSLVLYKCCQQCGFTARLILGPASVTSPSPPVRGVVENPGVARLVAQGGPDGQAGVRQGPARAHALTQASADPGGWPDGGYHSIRPLPSR
ncbi:MAG TPA: hypothetical protein VLX59_11405, partial [Acidimicrobiales bacterium]|nr:hypothetical protein [Acidimicrobiales bacterium]